MIELRGMTWNHPRGIDPLVAHARAWKESHGVSVTWDARSLEDFEAFPLDELAATYDLMVIDHPHVGMAAASGCLLPFDPSIHFDTVGRSHESYFYAGKQWALAIDAAAQVAASRADSLGSWPRDFDEVLQLARQERVLCPLAPVHALMCFFTLCAHTGKPCGADQRGEFVNPLIGQMVLQDLRTLAAHVPEFCLRSNPIDIFERMAADEQFLYAPLIYGYVSYSRNGFRLARIDFGPAPIVRGSTLGGTGIAVSGRSKNPQIAVAVALDLASSQTQCGVYAQAGGQPAHRDAWTDNAVNAATHDFYRNTMNVLDSAYLRPRFNGYIAFQERAGRAVAACVRCEKEIDVTIRELNELFSEAQSTP